MNWSLRGKTETQNYGHLSRHLTIKISESGLLLALAIATSFLCIEVMPKITGFLQFDLGIFFLLISLYIVKYWFTLIITIIHGFSTTVISGSWVGGFANAIIGVSLITIWFLLILVIFNKKITKDNDHEVTPNYHYQWLNWGLLTIISTFTVVLVSIIGVLSNKYFLLHLYGFDSYISNSHYLWIVLLPFNIINLSLNILIFIITIPTVVKIIKLKNS